MIAIDGWEANLRADGGAERVEAALVSPGFFEALGVMPAVGRAFTADEAREGQHRRVILSDALWRRTFGGEPMLGRTVMLERRAVRGRGHRAAEVPVPRTGRRPGCHSSCPRRARRAATSTT